MKTATTLRRVLCATLWLWSLWLYGQTPDPIQYSPGGLLDNVYDHYGNHYTLDDIKIDKETPVGVAARYTDPGCTSGMFQLYFDSGCGMDNATDATHIARRAVLCKVFSDLSAFINGPLNHGSSSTKVNIWIRPFSSVSTSTTTQAMASGFTVYPAAPTATTVNGGVLDNEVWKTIHTGTDSYLGYAAPLLTPPGSFYHGMLTINWDKVWNLDPTLTTFTGIDLYSIVLHEVMHALGFNTLIDSDGHSRLGTNYNYYSRYDTFLKTNTGLPLISTANTCSGNSLYNYTYNNNALSALHTCASGTVYDYDPWNCTSEINFVGSGAPVPVYNPVCYKPGSSLSHFEDSCMAGQTNNQYFVMSNAGPTNTPKRFPKPEECNALSDIGYSLQTTFNGHAYTGISTQGITVAGRCDGLNGNNYLFMPTSGTTLNLAGSDLLNNDYSPTPANLRYECLQDVYHDADGTTTITGISGSSSTAITFTSTATGIHLLRYVPYDVVTGKRGNITYVYIFVDIESANSPTTPPNNYTCIPQHTTCDLVSNGDFEEHEGTIVPSIFINRLNLACGWLQASLGLTSADLLVPMANGCTYNGKEFDNISGNNHFAGMFFETSRIDAFQNKYIENLKTKLSTPLLANKTYMLRFNVSQSDSRSLLRMKFQAFLTSNDITLDNTMTSPPPKGYFPDFLINSGNGILLENNDFSNTTNGWETVSLIFNTGNNANQQYLYIGGINNIHYYSIPGPSISTICYGPSMNESSAYYYIDNISLVPLDFTFNPTMTQVCVGNPAVNLNNMITPSMPPGATFSGAGVSVSGGVYTFNATAAGLGVKPITFTYTNSLGCPISVTQNITVVNGNIVPVFLDIDHVCSGETFGLPTTSTNDITGTWSPAIINTATTTYTFTPTTGQCATTATMTVTINTTTPPTASAQTFCSTSNPTVASLTATGTNLQWYATATGGTALLATTPLNTGSYYVSQTVNGCESTRTPVSVTINTTAAPSATSPQPFCSNANPTVANLTTTGTNIQWYTTATGGTALLTTTPLSTATYYVSQTVNGCESTRTPVNVTVSSHPTAPTASAETFCSASNPTVASLTASGTNLQWYTTATGGSALAATTLLITGTYYVSQTVNGCESTRTPVSVTINSTTPPTASAQTFCSASNPTVANLTATGTNLQWYTTATGGTPLLATTLLSTATYYVSQTINGCESTRTPVSVTVTSSLTPPTASSQTFCNTSNPTVANLTATGTNLQWYATATGGTALPATTSLSTGTYYVSQTVNGCESTRTPVNVTVSSSPTAPTASAKTFCSASNPTVASLTATGTNLQWYTTATGGTPLLATTLLSTGTYYVSQTVNGCESTRTPVSVTVNPNPIINTQPIAQTVCTGSSPSLTVVAAGTGLTYQWYSTPTNSNASGTIITSATSSTYNPPTSNIGTFYYYVVVKSSGCSVKSAVAMLTVNGATITGFSPATQGICVSTTPLAITVTATGSGTIAYQWYSATTLTSATNYTGTLITSATNAAYLPPTSATAVTRYYYVKLTVGGCVLYSSPFTVSFNTKPVINTITGTQTLCKGAIPTNLVATVTGATSYQWYVATSSSAAGTPISGATSTTYTPPTTDPGSFYYYIVASNNGCTATSARLIVTVNGATITTTSPTTQNVCTGSVVSLQIQATGYYLSCKWYSNTTPTTTGGTLINTGTSTTISGINYTFKYNVPANYNEGAKYYYAVISSTYYTCPTTTSSVFTINYYYPPSVGTLLPLTQAVCPNTPTTPITVDVTTTSASPNLTYQWYSNTVDNRYTGTPIAGATASSYTPPATAVSSLYYYVVVQNNGTCATPSKTTSFVNVIGPVITNATPATQTVCPNSTAITPLQVTATGNNLTYQWYFCGTNSSATGMAVTNATGTSYTPTVTAPGIYYYYVKVTENGNCTSKSPIYAVTILQGITIQGNPRICLTEWNGTSLAVSPAMAGTWTSSNPAIASVNATTGAVTGYAPGTVTISFNSIMAPETNCSTTGSIAITVLGSGSLVAINDNFTTPINTNTGGSTPSVLANDTVNGAVATTAAVLVQITNITSSPAQAVQPPFMIVDGNIVVPQGAPAATYTITYQIKSIGCSTTITATATAILVVNQVNVPSPPIAVGVRANDIVMDVDTQSTGKIIISGYFDTYNQVPCNYIAQLNNDLTLDTNFNASGPYPADYSTINAYDMKVIKNTGPNFNKILLGGWFKGWSGGTNGLGIARLLENGNLDTSFNTQPLATSTSFRGFVEDLDTSVQTGFVFEVFVFPDTAPAGYAGKILVGGSFNRYNGYVANGLVLLDANGDYNTSTSFNTNININGGFLNGVGGFALQTVNGTPYILVGGSFAYFNGANYSGLIRLNLDGTLDTTFGSLAGGGLVHNIGGTNDGYEALKKTIVVQPVDNKIIVGGYFHKYNSSACNNLVRLTANGDYDPSFATGTGFGGTINPLTGDPYSFVRDLYLDTAQMKLYACGDFTSYNGTACDEVVRIKCGVGAGTQDLPTSFSLAGGGPNGTNNGPVWCMKKQEGDDKIIIGGKFTYYTDTTHPALNVTRIYPSANAPESKNSILQYESEPEIDIFTTTDVVLYPNPTDGLLNYKLPNYNDTCTISIYDMMGKLVKTIDVDKTNDKKTIDCSDLPSATYLVRFNLNSKSVTKTIIKR